MAGERTSRNRAVWLALGVGLVLGAATRPVQVVARTTCVDTTRTPDHGKPVVAKPAPTQGGRADLALVKPESIPRLSPEIKARCRSGHRPPAVGYSDEQLARGVNLFQPVTAGEGTRDWRSPSTARPPSAGSAVAGPGRLRYWGSFHGVDDAPPRAIVEVVGEPAAWTGQVGEVVTGTLFRLDRIDADGSAIELVAETGRHERLRVPLER